MPGWTPEQQKALQDTRDADRAQTAPVTPRPASKKVPTSVNPGVGPGIKNDYELHPLAGPYPEDMPDWKRKDGASAAVDESSIPPLLRRPEPLSSAPPTQVPDQGAFRLPDWRAKMEEEYAKAPTVAARNAAALAQVDNLDGAVIPWPVMAAALDKAVSDGMASGRFVSGVPAPHGAVVPPTPETDRAAGLPPANLVNVADISPGYSPPSASNFARGPFALLTAAGLNPVDSAAQDKARAAIAKRVIADWAAYYNTTPEALEMEAHLRGVPWAATVEKAKRGAGLMEGGAIGNEAPATRVLEEASRRGANLTSRERLPLPTGMDIDDKAFSPNFTQAADAGIFYDPEEDDQVVRPGEKGHDAGMALLDALERDGIDASWLSSVKKTADPFQSYMDRRVPDLMARIAPGLQPGQKGFDEAQIRAKARALAELTALRTVGLWTQPIFLRGLTEKEFRRLGITPPTSSSAADVAMNIALPITQLSNVSQAILPDVEIVGFGPSPDPNRPNLVLRQRSTTATVFDALDLPLYAGTALVENIAENEWRKEEAAKTGQKPDLISPIDAVIQGVYTRRDPVTAIMESDFAKPVPLYDANGNVLRNEDGTPRTDENWRPYVAGSLGLALSFASPDTLTGVGALANATSAVRKLNRAFTTAAEATSAYKDLNAIAEARTQGQQLLRASHAAEDAGDAAESARLRALAMAEFKRASEVEGRAFSESKPLLRNLDIADADVARVIEQTAPGINDPHLLADLDVPDPSGAGSISNALLNMHPSVRQERLNVRVGRLEQQAADRVALYSTDDALARIDAAFEQIASDPATLVRVDGAAAYRMAAPYLARLETLAKGDKATLDALASAREKLRQLDFRGFILDVQNARGLAPNLAASGATTAAEKAARARLRQQFPLEAAAATRHAMANLPSASGGLKQLRRAAEEAILANSESRAIAAGLLTDGLKKGTNPNLGVREAGDPTLLLQGRLKNVAPRLSKRAKELLSEAVGTVDISSAKNAEEVEAIRKKAYDSYHPIIAALDQRARTAAWNRKTSVEEEWARLEKLQADPSGSELAAAQGRGAEVLYKPTSGEARLSEEGTAALKQARTAKEACAVLAKHAPTEALRTIAASIAPYIPENVTFSAYQRTYGYRGEFHYASAYGPPTVRVYDPDDAETAIHELVHAATSSVIDTYKREEFLPKETKAAVERLQRIFNRVSEDPRLGAIATIKKRDRLNHEVASLRDEILLLSSERPRRGTAKYASWEWQLKQMESDLARKQAELDAIPEYADWQRSDAAKPYGITELHEFIAEAFSNPDFQDFLRQIPSEAKNTSLWQEVVAAVRRLFGMSENVPTSVLDDVLSVSRRVMEDNARAITEDIKRFEEPLGTPDDFLERPPSPSFMPTSAAAQEKLASAKTAREAALILAEHADDPYQRHIAAALAEHLPSDVSFRVWSDTKLGGEFHLARVDQFEDEAGLTRSAYRAGRVTVGSTKDARLILHELTHAATAQVIQRAVKQGGVGLTDEAKAAVSALEAAFDDAKAALTRRGDKEALARYGFTDINEFVAEAFSNPDFQALLRSIPSYNISPISLWERFVSGVRKVLGIAEDVPMSVFDDVMNAAPSVMKENLGVVDDLKMRGAAGKAGEGYDYIGEVERGTLYQDILATRDVSKLAVPEGFFSPLQRALDTVLKKGGPDGVRASVLLRDAKKQPGVKADELEWSGIAAWLESQGEAKVTRRQLAEEIAKREPVVEVVGAAPADANLELKRLGVEIQTGVEKMAALRKEQDAALTALRDMARPKVAAMIRRLLEMDPSLKLTERLVGRFLPADESGGLSDLYLFDSILGSETHPGWEVVDRTSDAIQFSDEAEAYRSIVANRLEVSKKLNRDQEEARRLRSANSSTYSTYVAPGPSENYREIRFLQNDPNAPIYLSDANRRFERARLELDRLGLLDRVEDRDSILSNAAEMTAEDTISALDEMDLDPAQYEAAFLALREYAESSDVVGIAEKQRKIATPGPSVRQHFEPNTIAHLRTTDRVGPNGEKVLFIEEVQSDWHQAGAKRGYTDAEDDTLLKKIYDDVKTGRYNTRMFARNMSDSVITLSDGTVIPSRLYARAEDVVYAAADGQPFPRQVGRVNPGSHSALWRELALKQALSIAAREGYDGVALTKGEIIRGVVGGEEEGQLVFYNEMLPKTLERVAGKGAKLDKTRLNLRGAAEPDAELAEAIKYRDQTLAKYNAAKSYDPPDAPHSATLRLKAQLEHAEKEVKRLEEARSVPYLPITPELRARIADEGMALYSPTTGQLRTETPEFKRWFGESKVVGEDGKPLVVYHGTTGSFDEFSTDGSRNLSDEEDAVHVPAGDPNTYFGAHFAQESEVANKFTGAQRSSARWLDIRHGQNAHGGNIVPVFLSIKNPARMHEDDLLRLSLREEISDDALLEETFARHYDAEPESDEISALFERYNKEPEFREEVNRHALDEAERLGEDGTLREDLVGELGTAAKQRLRARGYDGVVYQNAVEGGTSWIAFDPEQVKSVFNRGTWDPEDARILYSPAYLEADIAAQGSRAAVPANRIDPRRVEQDAAKVASTPAFRRWFGKSQSVSPDGAPLVFYHGSSEGSIDAFDTQQTAYGYYFAPDVETAKDYANRGDKVVYPVFIRAEKILDLTDDATRRKFLLDEVVTEKPVWQRRDKYGEYVEVKDRDVAEWLKQNADDTAIDELLADFNDGAKNPLDAATLRAEDAWDELVEYSTVSSDHFDHVAIQRLLQRRPDLRVKFEREFISESPELTDIERSWGDGQNFYMNHQDNVMHAAENAGYDAVVFDDPTVSGMGQPVSWVVFDPKNIKSVYNEGGFEESADILYSEDAAKAARATPSAADARTLEERRYALRQQREQLQRDLTRAEDELDRLVSFNAEDEAGITAARAEYRRLKDELGRVLDAEDANNTRLRKISRISDEGAAKLSSARTAKQAARVIAEYATDPSYRYMAQRLAGQLDNDTTFELLDPDEWRALTTGTGLYTAPEVGPEGFRAGRIRMPVGDNDVTHDVKTALHEIAHAVTHTQMALYNTNPELLSDTARLAAGRLEAIYQTMTRSDLRGGRQYGFTNVDEMIAEAFSNPEFQAYLRSRPAMAADYAGENRSLWSEFVSAVRALLKLEDAPHSLLDDILDASDKLANEHKTSLSKMQEAAAEDRLHTSWYNDSDEMDGYYSRGAGATRSAAEQELAELKQRLAETPALGLALNDDVKRLTAQVAAEKRAAKKPKVVAEKAEKAAEKKAPEKKAPEKKEEKAPTPPTPTPPPAPDVAALKAKLPALNEKIAEADATLERLRKRQDRIDASGSKFESQMAKIAAEAERVAAAKRDYVGQRQRLISAIRRAEKAVTDADVGKVKAAVEAADAAPVNLDFLRFANAKAAEALAKANADVGRMELDLAELRKTATKNTADADAFNALSARLEQAKKDRRAAVATARSAEMELKRAVAREVAAAKRASSGVDAPPPASAPTPTPPLEMLPDVEGDAPLRGLTEPRLAGLSQPVAPVATPPSAASPSAPPSTPTPTPDPDATVALSAEEKARLQQAARLNASLGPTPTPPVAAAASPSAPTPPAPPPASPTPPSTPPTPPTPPTGTLPLIIENGKITLDALASPDTETLLHAVGHVLRQGLDEDEVAELNRWLASAGPSAYLDPATGRWVGSSSDVQAAEDAFTDAFRDYLVSGAPPPGLNTSFSDMKNSLGALLGAAPSGILPPETQALFDRLMGFVPSKEAQDAAAAAAKDPQATRPSFLSRYFTGPPAPAGPQVYAELAKAAQSAGLDVTPESLKETIANKKRIEFPVPVLGRVEYTLDNLADMQKKLWTEWSASRDEATQRLPTTGSAQAHPNRWLTDKVDAALVEGDADSEKMKRAKQFGRLVSATLIGMDAQPDLKKFANAVRPSLLVGERRVETAYADAVKITAERDPAKMRDYLLGKRVTTKHGGAFASSGTSKAGPVRDILSGVIDEMPDEARRGLDLLKRDPAVDTLSEQDRTAVARAVEALLYKDNAPRFSKDLVAVLNLPQLAPGSGVINGLPQVAPYVGALARFATDTDEVAALDALVEGTRRLQGNEAAARVQVLLAGHGEAADARSVWRDLGIAISRADAVLFKKWVMGERVPEGKLDDIRRIARRFGMDSEFVEDSLSAANRQDFIPDEVNKRMVNALSKKTQERQHILGTKVTSGPVDALKDVLASYVTALKVMRTRGLFALRTWKVVADSIDHIYQMAQVNGLGTGLATSMRILPQTMLATFPLLPRLAYHLEGRVIQPGTVERARRYLQSAGDAGARLVSRVMGRGALRIEVNDILKGDNAPITIGNVVYRPGDLLRIATEEGIFSSFPRDLDNVFRRSATDAASTWGKLGAVPHEMEQFVDDMAEGWASRERLGAMVTLMEMGIDPRTSARLTVDALFDYGASVANAERSLLMSFFFPFWAFEKNARRLQVNALFSAPLLYRMVALHRFQEYGPNALTSALYNSAVDPYGLDPSQLPPEARENYYAIRSEVESRYGRDPKTGLTDFSKVPPVVRDALGAILRGVGGWDLRQGRLYETPASTQELVEGARADARFEMTSGAPARLGTSSATQPRPDASARSTFRRDVGGIGLTPKLTKNLDTYYKLMRAQYGNVPYLEIYAPETTIETGIRGVSSTLATYAMALGILKDTLAKPLSDAPEPGDPLASWETSAISRLAQPLRQVFDPERSFVLPEIADWLTDSELAAPVRISKVAYDALQSAGYHPIAVSGVKDPFAPATGSTPTPLHPDPRAVTQNYQDQPESLKGDRYYMPPGLPSVVWEMSGSRALDQEFFLNPNPALTPELAAQAQSGLERAMDRPGEADIADVIQWLKYLIHVPVDEVNRSETARREAPKFKSETLTPRTPQ